MPMFPIASNTGLGCAINPYPLTTPIAVLSSLASQTAVGTVIYVQNPAVGNKVVGGVLGATNVSKLVHMGQRGYRPPRDEPLVNCMRIASSAIVELSLGSTALGIIYQSEIVPDYMLPDGVMFAIDMCFSAYNASGSAGCVLGTAIVGATPTGTSGINYVNGGSVTPDTSWISTTSQMNKCAGMRSGSSFYHGIGDGRRSIVLSTTGPFTSGANRLYAMMKPSKADDVGRLDYVSVVSLGAP